MRRRKTKTETFPLELLLDRGVPMGDIPDLDKHLTAAGWTFIEFLRARIVIERIQQGAWWGVSDEERARWGHLYEGSRDAA